jgi:hypothetical protein
MATNTNTPFTRQTKGRVIALKRACMAAALGLCLAQAARADQPPVLTAELLDDYGFTTKQSLDAKPCTFRLTLDQTRFNEIMPKLLKQGMIGQGQSLEFANQHLTGMETTWSLTMVSLLVAQTYRTNLNIDRCAFEGRFLVPDDYGNAQDRLVYSFDFDRALFKRIDWTRMELRKLPTVAKHFQYSDWAVRTVGKEIQ